MTLRIVPVGEGLAVGLLDELAAALALRLHVGCHVELNAVDAGFAWEQRRNQYWSTALLRALVERTPDEAPVLGVTALDLYVPVLTFVFGEAQIGGRAALVSIHRLRNEFYGLPAAPDLLLERLTKEAVHEIGHTYGLRHCSEWNCVMSSSHAVERLDAKSDVFCPGCVRAMAGRG